MRRARRSRTLQRQDVESASDCVAQIRTELRANADPNRAAVLQRYFKTRPGEYGAGDRFLGLRVPEVRRIAARRKDATLSDAQQLLVSQFHEERLLALLLMIELYRKGDKAIQETIFRMYLDHTPYINNWDLVDCSAPLIVGPHLEHAGKQILGYLARSSLLWERRIAMLATFHFIRKGHFDDALHIAEMLMFDSEDLIHKACGWMLREIGKQDRAVLELFLDRHYRRMPRVMLRYATEHLPKSKRSKYASGKR